MRGTGEGSAIVVHVGLVLSGGESLESRAARGERGLVVIAKQSNNEIDKYLPVFDECANRNEHRNTSHSPDCDLLFHPTKNSSSEFSPLSGRGNFSMCRSHDTRSSASSAR